MVRRHALTQDQLECLTMPLRLAIVQRLESDKEATARELAARMGRPTTSLYHHLKQLEEIGLVRIVGERKGPRRPEAIYALVADDYTTVEAVKTDAGRKTYARAATRVAEGAARALSAAVEAEKSRFQKRDRNTMVRFFMFRADGAKLAQINKLIGELEASLWEANSEDGEEMMFTVLMSPQPIRA